MYVSPQEIPFDSPLSRGLAGSLGNLGSAFGGQAEGPLSALVRGDNVLRVLPPQGGNAAGGALGMAESAIQTACNPLGAFINSIGALLSQLANYVNGSAAGQGGGERQFANAAASSTGDPHLAFSGTTANGSGESAKWDDMNSHADLLDSASFAGGYRVSTAATAPDADGVTFNGSASIGTNGGATRVSLDANGNATLFENGRTRSIADGDRLDLGNGETVVRANDGSLTVNDSNGRGGSISTTLSDNGRGVDVNVSAQNVALGGYLANANGANPYAPAPGSAPIGGWQPSAAHRYPYSRSYDFDDSAFDAVTAAE